MVKKKLLAAATLVIVTSVAPVADAWVTPSSTKITVMTVSDYSYQGSSNTDADAEGDGFWNEITQAGTGYTAGSLIQDSHVYDIGFTDPDLGVSGLDSAEYDQPGTAISLAIVHGVCDDANDYHYCTSDTDCAAGSYCPGGTALGPYEQRVCTRQLRRTIVTSSPTNFRGNLVYYGQTYGSSPLKALALGEDSYSGAFGGAGTNGGDNVAILVNSCGFRSRYFVPDTSYFFAGLHSFLFYMPTKVMANSYGVTEYSDTAFWGDRGITVANDILVNESASVYNAWLDPWNAANSYTISGVASGDHADGANMIMAYDATSTAASWHVNNENWLGAYIDTNDAVGNAYYSYKYLCNYSCDTLGW